MRNNVFTVKDDNGREFKTSISDIIDFNTDSDNASEQGSFGINDSSATKMLPKGKIPKMEVRFSDGRIADPFSVISDMKSGKLNVVAVDIEAEATHNGLNLNDCMYYEDSMEKDAESFMNPFEKPVLKNHNSHSGEPLGRTKSFRVSQSNIDPAKTAIFLSARITDEESFEKFLDGRYQTVSIGGSMGTVTCNLCGKNILKDGVFKFCGHWKGESYNGKKCTWGARDLTYHEWSIVNSPADQLAIITKANIVVGNDSSDDSNKKQEDQTVAKPNSKIGDNTDLTQKKETFFGMLDELLAAAAVPAEPAKEVPDDTKDSNPEPKEDPAKTEDGKDPVTTEDSVKKEDHEKVVKELADAQELIKTMEQEIEDSKQQKETMEQELKEANDSKESLENDLKITRDNLSSTAVLAKEMVIDFIVAGENLAEDAIESKKTDLMAKSMKELYDMKGTYAKQVRQKASVKSPALSGKDSDVGGAEDSKKKESKVADKHDRQNPIQNIINSIGVM